MSKNMIMDDLIKNFFIERKMELSANGNLLNLVVHENGKDILKDEEKLIRCLEDKHAEKAYIYRLCIMTGIPGFDDLLLCDMRTINVDLTRYIRNAVHQTGFEMNTILSLVTELLVSMDAYEMISADVRSDEELLPDNFSYPIPECIYEDELHAVSSEFYRFNRMIRSGKMTMDEIDLDKLTPLVKAGIPQAKYFMGYYMLYGGPTQEVCQDGIRLIKESAVSGCAEAAAALGDYYYQKGGLYYWSEAYHWYTGPGALALNEYQKNAVKNILNHKYFNRKILIFTLAVIVAFFIMILIAPAAPLYAPMRILGVICTLLQVGVFLVTARRFMKYPYEFIYYLPLSSFCIMFVYFMIRMF